MQASPDVIAEDGAESFVSAATVDQASEEAVEATLDALQTLPATARGPSADERGEVDPGSLAVGMRAQATPPQLGAVGEAALQPLVSFKRSFFTFNVCGACDPDKPKNREPVAVVVANVEASKPVAFALQEACASQVREISRSLRGRGLGYSLLFRNFASPPTKLNPSCPGLDKRWGNAIFLAGPLGEIRHGNFANQRDIRSPRGYACALVPVRQSNGQSTSFWACSTHMDTEREHQQAQIGEMERIARGLHDSLTTKRAVAVGGDFNVGPSDIALDDWFRPRLYPLGRGIFDEVGVTSEPGSFDRIPLDDRYKTAHGQKMDYTFTTFAVQGGFREVDSWPATSGGNSDHKIAWILLGFL